MAATSNSPGKIQAFYVLTVLEFNQLVRSTYAALADYDCRLQQDFDQEAMYPFVPETDWTENNDLLPGDASDWKRCLDKHEAGEPVDTDDWPSIEAIIDKLVSDQVLPEGETICIDMYDLDTDRDEEDTADFDFDEDDVESEDDDSDITDDLRIYDPDEDVEPLR